ncbi:MAG: glycosyltransferase [Candidatus Eisenbacteria bacterium]|uniref:Glycosyltransferase n=1 Tax=Eiseniibacteriota bacterium TaxID=2212470 RepID=A0A937XD02_UNCEI|nr:glycosyltransferase [Candidatus Eisenbacteria bacterium]
MRRLLMVLYYFPPSGGPGVQRGLKFARYLPEFGWRPHVLTVPATSDFPVRDETLLAEVPDGLAVTRARCPEFYGLYRALTGQRGVASLDIESMSRAERRPARRALRWLRAAAFIPDGRVAWIPFAVRAGTRLSETPGYDAIFSSGPPFTCHLIGRVLRRRTGKPWVADYRDPWTQAPFYPRRPGFARRIDERLEEACLREADASVVVGGEMARSFREGRPGLDAGALEVIPNGYDEADFAGVPFGDAGLFRMTHTGSLFLGRIPHALFSALERLTREEPEWAGRARLCFAGRVDRELRARLAAPPLAAQAEWPGYLPHAESVALLRRSQLLLLLIGSDAQSRGMLTGKIYEYLAAGVPILALGPRDGDAARLLERTGAGWIHEPEDEQGIRDRLRTLWRAWRASREGAEAGAAAMASRAPEAGGDGDASRAGPAGPDAAMPERLERAGLSARAGEIARYSRRALTGELARLLDRCAGGRDRG